SKRLLRLVNQLLDFQKLGSASAKIKLSPVWVSPFLETCSEYFRGPCRERNIRFRIRDVNNKDSYILGQIDALEKILFNYLSNALKYTNDWGNIELSLQTENDRVIITVKDDGPGISNDNKAKLFNIFSTVEDRVKRQYEKTGIGLALVKELTEAMKGRVFFESEVGKGSTFGVEFLRYDPNAVIFHLLVISEQDEHVSGCLENLKQKEFIVAGANSLAEAMNLLSKSFFYCILLDFDLLNAEGTDFMQILMANHPFSKLLVMAREEEDFSSSGLGSCPKSARFYKKPLDIAKFMLDLKMFMKESQVEPDIIIENLREYRPKGWHLSVEGEMSAVTPDEECIEGDGKLILVVDDLKDMRTLITNALKSKSYRFITAEGGSTGLKKASLHRPDLVIIDWMMPTMTGTEMIEEMQKNDILRSIPIILLTAKGDEESKKIAIQKGAHAYLAKPFDDLELFNTIDNLILLKEGEKRIRELNRNLTENLLKRFLPHKLVDDITSGKKLFSDHPRLLEVTILFAGLAGFTKRSEEAGPVLISQFLNSYFDKMTKIVFKFGGTVDKFIGDEIMVIFGAPEEIKNNVQARNAIGCAIEMQKALDELNMEWKNKKVSAFSMRIGIHKGSGIVGSFGGELRSEYTVIGPVVNMASRIERCASPGHIFFSSTIRDILEEKGWSRAGNFDLKGIGETMLYKVDIDKWNLAVDSDDEAGEKKAG
ncbi:MAG: response regulator, partial [Oligoflexales bacterium]|nr:response regulator [Oligoflexales bacterium]